MSLFDLAMHYVAVLYDILVNLVSMRMFLYFKAGLIFSLQPSPKSSKLLNVLDACVFMYRALDFYKVQEKLRGKGQA